MDDLAEFLLARIAEDQEDAARGYLKAEPPRGYDPGWDNRATVGLPPVVALRVLAECDSKRRIVSRHRRTDPDHWDPGACEGCGWTGDPDFPRTGRDEVCPELADLALAYVNHPDYRDGWRPEGASV